MTRADVRHLVMVALLLAGALVWAVVPAGATGLSAQQERYRELLVDRALAHGADPAEVTCIAYAESSLDPAAVGSHGERGFGQWVPGRGNHWDRTPAWRRQRIDIVAAYRAGDPDAVWIDADMLAWSFGPEAETLYPGNQGGWSTRGLC